jgi:sulfatase modifying factor 1
MNFIRFARWLAIGVLGACGGEPVPTTDAGERDSGAHVDASTRLDAGESDAGGGEDADVRRDSGVDAGLPPEHCASPGQRRTAPCGNCGLRAEECSADSLWVPISACTDEGACAPGAVEAETAAMCEARERVCDNGCSWRDWTIVSGPGECEPGERRRTATATCGALLRQEQECGAACSWVDDGGCVDACGATARTSPEWLREVCVSEGPFLRGEPGTIGSNSPQSEIMVSAFYIGAYPVTHRRYQECLDARGCATLGFSDDALRMQLDNPGLVDHPVRRLTWHRAEEFCAWDGGRQLPTEAQWEKAARGPSPRVQGWPWDDDVYHCEYVLDCPPDVAQSVVYSALPMTRSYFGTFMQYGGTREWMADWYASDWYTRPESITPDPTGPGVGTERSIRGLLGGDANFRISQRSFGPPRSSTNQAGVRCVRPADLP